MKMIEVGSILMGNDSHWPKNDLNRLNSGGKWLKLAQFGWKMIKITSILMKNAKIWLKSTENDRKWPKMTENGWNWPNCDVKWSELAEKWRKWTKFRWKITEIGSIRCNLQFQFSNQVDISSVSLLACNSARSSLSSRHLIAPVKTIKRDAYQISLLASVQ